MKTAARFLLTFYLLLATSQRLPAPISELPQTTPIPKPKREATPRPKSKPKPEATSKPTSTPNRSFAGNWTGNVISNASNGESGSYSYVVRISDDEKTVWINWGEAGQTIGGPGRQTPCNRFRETLTWSLTYPESTITDTLRLNTDGTSSFVREGAWVAGDNEGITYHQTGILSREGASVPPSGSQTTTSGAPQPTTAGVPKNAGGLPIAKPVPNKPGFVYNPFDPNSKVLLDVRGRASGTKLKDPFSRKLFIIP